MNRDAKQRPVELARRVLRPRNFLLVKIMSEFNWPVGYPAAVTTRWPSSLGYAGVVPTCMRVLDPARLSGGILTSCRLVPMSRRDRPARRQSALWPTDAIVWCACAVARTAPPGDAAVMADMLDRMAGLVYGRRLAGTSRHG